MGASSVLDDLASLSDRVQARFAEERRLLSFGEYLELFAANPARHARDAAGYLRDLFDHYGRGEVRRPWGTQVRYHLFDLPFLDEEGRRRVLVGHEALQGEIYRVLCNFVREGRANRVVLLHGPNGSAKSTIAHCIMRALEHYSTLDEGALYRFHWVFPTEKTLRGSIGFRGHREASAAQGSYARLEPEDVDSRLFVEVRDHPLFLIPERERRTLLSRYLEGVGVSEQLPEWVLRGELSHKNRQIYEALLVSYSGSLTEVLRHVQVERYFISRRYRVGAVTLGPELSVDASERQVTADRSVAALPAALQSLSLFDVQGELVDAAGGVLEFSDLLKRPLDAFKYLQITAETGEVALHSQNLQTNCVMLASGNELHLQAFREHPEFESFRGRFELLRAPYLLDYRDEQAIYDAQVVPLVRCRVARHATRIAAMFAVLTRLQRPNGAHYEGPLRELVVGLSPMEKLQLYATGESPRRLDVESRKTLRAAVGQLVQEGETAHDEGGSGASPREMRSVLLDAAQDSRFDYLSPVAVLERIEQLCARTSEYAWLQQQADAGGFHDHAAFREVLRGHLLDLTQEDFRAASGLVEQERHVELFDRYLSHVGAWTGQERIRNPITGTDEEADERMMAEVEQLLGATDEPKAWRHGLLGRIAAWAIDHPGEFADRRLVFEDQLRQLREASFAQHRDAIVRLCRDAVVVVREQGVGLDTERQVAARRFVDGLVGAGYPETAVADMAWVLIRERFEATVS